MSDTPIYDELSTRLPDLAGPDAAPPLQSPGPSRFDGAYRPAPRVRGRHAADNEPTGVFLHRAS